MLHFRRDKYSRRYKTIIVGAGLAGLGAAKTLVEGGDYTEEDFLILESSNRPGGRIHTVPYENSFIELGAQWLHDTENELYKISAENGLLSEETSEEGLGEYIRDDGKTFKKSLVDEIDFVVGKILCECESYAKTEQAGEYPESVGHFLREKFADYLSDCSDSQELAVMKTELLDWHMRFQIIDNACLTLHDLSAKDWGKYSCMSSSGQKHINYKRGYGSLVDVLVQTLPENCILFDSPVEKIKWHRHGQNGEDHLTLLCRNSDNHFHCDSVIVTCSLGVLKYGRCEFDPPLSQKITRGIADIGFYGIGKIFLHFGEKWWKCEGFQLLWRNETKLPVAEQWTRYISGFDNVWNHPNILMGWVGGRGLLQMENLTEEVVGQQCVALLRKFIGNSSIPDPIKVFK